MAGTGRPKRRLARWSLRLALMLAVAGAVEVGFRVWLSSRGTPYDSAAVAESLRKRLRDISGETFLERERALAEGEEGAEFDTETTGRIPHPFHGWQTVRGAAQLEDWMRATPALPENVFLVWIVGGSVAGIFGNEGSGLEPLVARLSADPRLAGREVVVHNYARAAFKQPQQVTLVTHLFSLGLAPDAVINIDGFNEVAIGNMNAVNGSDPTYPDLTQWGDLVLSDETAPEMAKSREALFSLLRRTRRLSNAVLATGLHHSAGIGWWSERFLGHWAWKRGRLEAEYKEALLALGGDVTLRGPGGGGGRDELRASVTNWVESSRSLHAVCAARDVFYLHVLQPTLHDADAKPLSPEELAAAFVRDSWLSGARDGYPLLRAAAGELEAAGVAFADTSDAFAGVTETLYYDACHFNLAGNLLLAERIADAFLAGLPR